MEMEEKTLDFIAPSPLTHLAVTIIVFWGIWLGTDISRSKSEKSSKIRQGLSILPLKWALGHLGLRKPLIRYNNGQFQAIFFKIFRKTAIMLKIGKYREKNRYNNGFKIFKKQPKNLKTWFLILQDL